MTASGREEPVRPRLGRGLAALLGDTGGETPALQSAKAFRRIPLEFLKPNPFNPRKAFSEAELEDLAESIRKRGVLQSILVRAVPDAPDSFEIIAGERRWRAAQRAGIFDIPASIIEATDRQSLEIAIVENVQRADLNPIEEAQGYQKLCIDFGYSHGDLAEEIGKSRSHVANTLRLLNLPAEARNLLLSGVITAGHARALLTADDPEALAKKIVDDKLTVRDVEGIVQRAKAPRVKAPKETAGPLVYDGSENAEIKSLEKNISDSLGYFVSISRNGLAGTITIRYDSFDQLSDIANILLNKR